MSQSYSQSKALWAITGPACRYFSNPMSLVFSLLFPIIFILIFGAFGNGSVPVQKIAIRHGADTVNGVLIV
jgi:ABC-2 type transport system permease protein